MTSGGRTVVSQLSFLVASAIFAASGAEGQNKTDRRLQAPAVRDKNRVSGSLPAVQD
jgi:hypothetical protein